MCSFIYNVNISLKFYAYHISCIKAKIIIGEIENVYVT